MNLTRCDVCEKELSNGYGAISEGFTVERRDGIDVGTPLSEPGPWDVCSRACLSELGKRRGLS